MTLDQSKPVDDQVWRTTADVEVRRLTSSRPFCAGVLVMRDGSLLAAFSADGVDAAQAGGADWFVGGVGGGQEPGEDIWDCALREAQEELGVPVRLVSSPRTYLHDIDSDELRASRSQELPAPFIVQRIRNADATTAFKPGLPAGPFTYFCMFLAELADEEPVFQPNDPDIAALVWLPLNAEGAFTGGVTFADLTAAGAMVAAGGPIADHARIHVRRTETLRVAGPLLAAGRLSPVSQVGPSGGRLADLQLERGRVLFRWARGVLHAGGDEGDGLLGHPAVVGGDR
jgi:8-oxo-dGTP pyrophosphatase MutT (NUDIX family)